MSTLLNTAAAEQPTHSLPEKFLDQDGNVRIDALMKSYLELEKKFSNGSTSLIPSTPDEYCIDCSHGMFGSDPAINQRLHEKGMTTDQVQTVYDLAAEHLVPMIVELSAQFEADREVSRLVDYFGSEEKWLDISRQLLSYGQKRFNPQVLKGLSSSYEGVIALYQMMKEDTKSAGMPETYESQSLTEGDLHGMMRDPKYWRDRDPAFISKVRKGFESLYGSK